MYIVHCIWYGMVCSHLLRPQTFMCVQYLVSSVWRKKRRGGNTTFNITQRKTYLHTHTHTHTYDMQYTIRYVPTYKYKHIHTHMLTYSHSHLKSKVSTFYASICTLYVVCTTSWLLVHCNTIQYKEIHTHTHTHI